MMVWFLKLLVIWLSFDVVVIASGWYLVRAIKPKFPNWWRQAVADERPSVKVIQFDRTESGWNPVEALPYGLPSKHS
ncbi:MAG: hypothetical protein BroJett011_55760 [Chloroflexota bacterium]|nr:MAG: hypothetical protein BroJett011_55760 [Chloroflexota bacterium]